MKKTLTYQKAKARVAAGVPPLITSPDPSSFLPPGERTVLRTCAAQIHKQTWSCPIVLSVSLSLPPTNTDVCSHADMVARRLHGVPEWTSWMCDEAAPPGLPCGSLPAAAGGMHSWASGGHALPAPATHDDTRQRHPESFPSDLN
jgi:hypothetical protein